MQPAAPHIKILHLTHSQLAGAPLNLHALLNKYGNAESKIFLKGWFKARNLKELRWPYPQVNPGPEDVKKAMEWADVVIHHQRPWEGIPAGKPRAILYHALTGKYRPFQTHPEFKGRKMVVAQHQARYYSDALPVPNLIDIWDEAWMPGAKNEKPRVFMGVASETNYSWGFKNSAGVQRVFQQMNKRWRGQIETILLKGRPISEVIALKKNADIVIDECQTGSYHLSSIEGLSVGAATLNNIDEACLQVLKRVSGADEHPFVKCGMEQLEETLNALLTRREHLIEVQAASRTWVERYWNPRVHIPRLADQLKRIAEGRSLDLS